MNYRRNTDNSLESQRALAVVRRAKSIVEGLQALLADTYILYIKTQNFHWNVKGPNFGPLHQLFGDQYAELALAIDLIAERITALDGVAIGSCADFNNYTHLGEYYERAGKFDATDMIKSLLEDNEIISKECQSFMEKLDDYDDEATAHMVADRITAHDKAAWMLKSHLRE
jgi:starvation-inducible DNA-binding protein